jgi:hypothetical protein
MLKHSQGITINSNDQPKVEVAISKERRDLINRRYRPRREKAQHQERAREQNLA